MREHIIVLCRRTRLCRHEEKGHIVVFVVDPSKRVRPPVDCHHAPRADARATHIRADAHVSQPGVKTRAIVCVLHAQIGVRDAVFVALREAGKRDERERNDVARTDVVGHPDGDVFRRGVRARVRV